MRIPIKRFDERRHNENMNDEKTSQSWVDWHYVALPKGKTAACLKIAHAGAVNASFLKTLTTVPFSLHVSDLFPLHLHGTQATSIPFQHFPLIGVQISCAVIEEFIPRAIADKPCVVDFTFSNFLCGGLTIFDFFCNGGSSACLTMNSSRCIIVNLFVFSIKVIQIGAIRSTETYRVTFIIFVITMLFQRGLWKSFV